MKIPLCAGTSSTEDNNWRMSRHSNKNDVIDLGLGKNYRFFKFSAPWGVGSVYANHD